MGAERNRHCLGSEPAFPTVLELLGVRPSVLARDCVCRIPLGEPTATLRPAPIAEGENETILMLTWDQFHELLNFAREHDHQIKSYFERYGNPALANAHDIATVAKVLEDLGGLKAFFDARLYHRVDPRTGNVGVVIRYGSRGLPPGMRKLLTANTYLMTNSRVVNLGLGAVGVFQSGIKTGVIGFVLQLGTDLTWMMLQEMTDLERRRYLINSLGKNAISAAAAVAASVGASVVAGSALVGGAPIWVPLAAGIVVGYVVSQVLEDVDLVSSFEKLVGSIKDRIWQALGYPQSELDLVDRMMRAFGGPGMNIGGQW